MLPNSTRREALWVMLSVLAFVGAGTYSALSYPGGTHWDRSALGFGWTTFWCDLLRPVALDGRDNHVGAQAARFALFALALGLPPFFSLARTRLALGRRSGTAVAIGGNAAAVALALVAAGTGARIVLFHDWAILIGGPLGLCALTLVVISSARVDRAAFWLGLGALALGLWNLTQYAREALLEAPAWPGLPLVQKATTLSVVGFLVLFSSRAAYGAAAGVPTDNRPSY